MTYGAYFVRSRVTAAGANSVELLWPVSNVWPPEIDFNENLFHLNLATSTTHWAGHTDFQILKINMLEWHTWGVIWTPTYVLYVVDGHPWHEFTNASGVPHVPMVLDFEQRTTCPSVLRCPNSSSELLIDWVAEFQVAK
jgi:beta-glucanase (GH16 family)